MSVILIFAGLRTFTFCWTSPPLPALQPDSKQEALTRRDERDILRPGETTHDICGFYS